MRIAYDYKTACRDGAARYKIDDKLTGWTTPGRCLRRDYKKSTRLARRKLNMSVRAVNMAAYA